MKFRPRLAGGLRYALGEFALVVVGILVALQIDAWNSERQERLREKQYLAEIRESLLDDQRSLGSLLAFNTEKNNAIIQLLRVFASESDNTTKQSEIQAVLGVVGSYELFIPSRVSFDNMVSADNISIVSNPDIRRKLTLYYGQISPYEGTQGRIAQLSRNALDTIVRHLMHSESLAGFAGVPGLPIAPLEELVLGNDPDIYADLLTLMAITQRHSEEMQEIQQGINGFILELEEHTI